MRNRKKLSLLMSGLTVLKGTASHELIKLLQLRHLFCCVIHNIWPNKTRTQHSAEFQYEMPYRNRKPQNFQLCSAEIGQLQIHMPVITFFFLKQLVLKLGSHFPDFFHSRNSEIMSPHVYYAAFKVCIYLLKGFLKEYLSVFLNYPAIR